MGHASGKAGWAGARRAALVLLVSMAAGLGGMQEPAAQALPSDRASAFERGVRAHEAGQFEVALKAWTEAADAGSAAAAFNLGVMHDSGTGMPRHAALAAGWYRRAAEAGDLGAQVALARLSEAGGPGLPADVEEARLWYRVAAARTAVDPGDESLLRQARERLAALPAAQVEEVHFAGGRYLFRGLAAGRCLIALQGRIGPGATAAFDAVVERARAKGCGVPWIVLESGGGTLDDGIALGKEVHLSGYSTMVGRSCASACGLIFMGGRERILLGPQARIGLHQASRRSSARPEVRSCISSRYDSAYRKIRSYLQMVIGEASEAVHTRALETPCDSMTWVRSDEAIAMKIATAVR